MSLEDQLMPGSLEFAIHTLVETRLDTAGFEQKYRNDETRRTAYDPKLLLKIVLLGYVPWWDNYEVGHKWDKSNL